MTISKLLTKSKSDQYQSYFEEIRKKLVVVIIFFGLGSIVGFVFYQKILHFVLSRLNLGEVNIVFTSPYQFINLAVSISVLTGLTLALPYFIFQLLIFIKPALTRKEYRLLASLLPVSLVLLVIGFAFGIWTIQYVLVFYSQISISSNIGNMWDIGRFMSQMINTAIATSLIFQLPIILTCLIRLKIISRESLIKKRSVVYAILLIVAVLLPPTDIISLLVLVLPMLLLFEGALLINKQKKQERR